MTDNLSPHLRAILEALLVTFIWSISWVLIKIGLEDIPALTFAGLRYFLAFVVLLPFAWRGGHLRALRRLTRGDWARLALLGLFFYTVTQGGQFVTLNYLPAVTFSLLLNFTAVIVALLGIPLLGEIPTPLQWAGIAVFIGGVLIYFLPVNLAAGEALGLAVALITVLANAISSVLGRGVNRSGALSPLSVTVASMGIGSALLLGGGLGFQGLPRISLQGWAIIGCLAVVNTAFAFTLWNKTLKDLSATESSIINNTMLIQIAVLAWLFLGEGITFKEGIGLLVAAGGVLLVQVRWGRQPVPLDSD